MASSLRPEHPVPRSLARLAEDFGLEVRGSLEGVEVTGVSADAEDIEDDELFVGLPGGAGHGAAYAADARERGAAALLTDPAGADLAADSGLPVLVTADPREALGDLAAWVHRTAEHPPLLFAVTGTRGKTSVVHLLDAILRQLGVATGFSTTTERRAADESVRRASAPDAPELHALLARMRESGVRAAAVEVPAQALTQGMVGGLVFDVVGFTNLGDDHLDEYPDAEAYLAAKQSLFDPDRSRRGVVDVDGEAGRRVADEARIPITTVATVPGSADWTVTVTDAGRSGTGFKLEGPGGSAIESSVPLIGRWMATNAALAIVMLVESGFELEAIGHALERDGGILVEIPGLAERVSGEDGPAVFVDYGHAVSGVLATLDALRPITPGRVIVVLAVDAGSGVPAEHLRALLDRADLGIVAGPALPDPAGTPSPSVPSPTAAVQLVAEPREALRRALAVAEQGDSVLYAPTAHEDHLENTGVKHPYTARDDARLAIQEAGWGAPS
ncbi:Mur ligase family protein [Naasia sp. SYSU D00057]|uniref:Mur ligase family protein n=1 Tax=Naasia sp. SYSU D00057 TaxID=2817380 RepID=UPI001B307062|nr:Mur ligase family protein [Naasia sp. SYSU D00057]